MTAKRMIIMLLLVVVVFGGVLGMQEFGRRAMVDFLENMPTPPVTVSSAKVERMLWDDRIDAVGSLVAENGTDVSSEVPGVVRAIRFRSGQTVARGDVLVELDSETEQAELLRLEADARLADITRQRRERLFELESISRAEVDEAVSRAEVARAAVEAQRARLRQKRVAAPFDGVLGIRQVSVGDYIDPGQPLVSLQSLDPIEVRFTLPERELARVREGQNIEVRVEGHDRDVFDGEVIALESRVTEGTRNFDVQASLPNPDGVLRPGQFARVRVKLPTQQDVVVIPRTSVQYDSYGSSVYVVEDRGVDPPEEDLGPHAPPHTDLHVIRRFVQLGEARGDFIVVREGLEEGEEIASSGLLKLRNEQPVKINNDRQPDVELEPRAVPEG